jgi:hypothetical protein
MDERQRPLHKEDEHGYDRQWFAHSGDRLAYALGRPPRTSYTTETKPFFLTSEFVVFVLFVMGLAIGTATADDVDPRLFWILTTVATSAYMLARGIAKAASRSRAHDPRDDIDLGRE